MMMMMVMMIMLGGKRQRKGAEKELKEVEEFLLSLHFSFISHFAICVAFVSGGDGEESTDMDADMDVDVD